MLLMVCAYTSIYQHILYTIYHICRQLDAAVDRLSKQIRGLTNLTLKVVSTQPLSSTSRHTAPFYPLPHLLAGAGAAAGSGRIPRCLEPTELLLQLEGSGYPSSLVVDLCMTEHSYSA